MKIKVMTFNVKVYVLSDGINSWPHRFDKVAKLIKDENPDIIGIQELRPGMLQELASLLPEYNWVGLPRRENDEYTPIFYKKSTVQLRDCGTFWLSETPETPGSMSWKTEYPRICTWGEFQFLERPERQCRVFNTHLDNISELARINGVKVIQFYMNKLNNKNQLPQILTGDFNAYPASAAVKFWTAEQGFIDAYIKCDDEKNLRKTFHNFEGGEEGEPFDYIFVSPDIQILETKIIRSRVEEQYPSDHYPVCSRIDIM